jgi:tetratricopeptide (TPR) repeat protein
VTEVPVRIRRARVVKTLGLGVGVLVLAAVLGGAALFAAQAGAPRVWIEPFALPVDADAPRPERFAESLAAHARAMLERARKVGELGGEETPPRIAVVQGTATAALIAIRSLFLRDARIVGEVTFSPEHADVLVRDRSTQATLRSRVPRDGKSLDRLAALGAEDLVAIVAPLSAATLALDDPLAHSNGPRIERIRQAIAREPANGSDPRAVALEAAHEAANGRCRDALRRLDRVTAAHPAASRIQLIAADCHARLGARDPARERLDAVSEGATDAMSLTLAGIAYVRLCEPLRGLERLRMARQRAPGESLNAIAIGEALIALHRPGEALAWLRAHPVEARWRERRLAALGLAEVRSGDGPAAAATAALIRTEFPASLAPLRIEAELALATKGWPQALGRFSALKLMAPSDGYAHAGAGAAMLGLKQPAEAIAAYRACGDAAPWLAECRLGLGLALREADRTEEALAALLAAAELDALDPRIPDETARTLRALLRRDEAAAYSARAEAAAFKLTQKLPLP